MSAASDYGWLRVNSSVGRIRPRERIDRRCEPSASARTAALDLLPRLTLWDSSAWLSDYADSTEATFPPQDGYSGLCDPHWDVPSRESLVSPTIRGRPTRGTRAGPSARPSWVFARSPHSGHVPPSTSATISTRNCNGSRTSTGCCGTVGTGYMASEEDAITRDSPRSDARDEVHK